MDRHDEAIALDGRPWLRHCLDTASGYAACCRPGRRPGTMARPGAGSPNNAPQAEAGPDPMNFLILGDGPDEYAWARAIDAHPGHRTWAVYPSTAGGAAGPRDLDEALAIAGVEAAVVGGEPEFRAEALRRVAAVGLPALVLHPPGPNADPYYQVALSRAETGALVVPALPLRLHPGVEALREALNRGELGGSPLLRAEVTGHEPGADLVLDAFAVGVDAVRALLGEVDAVTATGEPPGDRPTVDLLVQLRAPQSRRAEIRASGRPDGPARLELIGPETSIALEYDPEFEGPARLVRRSASGATSVEEMPPWDGRAALLDVLDRAARSGDEPSPGLLDGTRAMELAEAAGRSLRKGRTVDLHYEEMTEAGNFRSVMTSLGCLLLLGVLVGVPAALAGPALGVGWTIYLAYAIPPILVGFILIQFLGVGARPKGPPPA